MASDNAPPVSARTRTFRIAGDLAGKLSELLDLLGGKSADYLDPLIRNKIEADHAANISGISAMRKARESREGGA